jgi:hypothetical protein
MHRVATDKMNNILPTLLLKYTGVFLQMFLTSSQNALVAHQMQLGCIKALLLKRGYVEVESSFRFNDA